MNALRPFLTRKNLGIAAGAALALALLYLAFRPESARVELGRVTRGLYEQAVEAEGVTRVSEKFTVLAPVSGVLQRVERHPGDVLRRGQAVATVVWDAPRAVLAPVNGRVLRVFRESAGPIEMGQPILEMADLGRMEIVADALTADAVQIQPGARARITGWGGDAPLEARVRLIEPAAFTRVSALGVEEQRVHVILDMLTPEDARPGLGDGFRVQCRIVVYQAADALKVPSSALFREGREWAVFVAAGDRAVKRVVQLARRNPEEALVSSGLKEGDQVILFPGESIRDGVRIER